MEVYVAGLRSKADQGEERRKQRQSQGKSPAEETDVCSKLFIFGAQSDTINIVPETQL